MHKFILIWAFGLVSSVTQAQVRSIDVDKDLPQGASALYQSINGEPVSNYKFTKLVEGSPYFDDDWMQGLVLLKNGNRCRGKMKLELYSNQLYYLDSAGSEFIANIPDMQVIELKKGEQAFRFVHRSLLNGSVSPKQPQWFLERYKSDSLQLYQYFQKDMREDKPYGSATVEQYIDTRTGFVLTFHKQVFSFQKVKEVAEFFPTHRGAILQYIKENPEKKHMTAAYMSSFAEFLERLLYSRK